MEDMSMIAKNFSKFLKKNKGVRAKQTKRFTKSNETSTSNKTFNCFEFGNLMDCPTLKKNTFKGKPKNKNGRCAYITWEDNNTISTSEP
ncbi:hypothetical protein Lal_00039896 [Lupinus albus]|nr:hypothetical protein Lal_00039896 [Lupinus albus]